MTATVISYQRPRRKRGGAWGWTLRRLGALVVTVLVLGAVAVFTPRPAPQPVVEGPPPAPVIQAPEPLLEEANVTLDLAGPPPPQRPARRTRAGIPLNAATGAVSDGYEILSAAELEAISQARD